MHARMRLARAEDHAFELAGVLDVDRVFGASRDLVPRFAPRSVGISAIAAPGASLAHRLQDAGIGAAAAEMAGERRGDRLARGQRGAVGLPPLVMEGGRGDDETRRAKAALQRIAGDEGFLHGMQRLAADALDGDHRPAARRARGKETARHRLAVEQHGAGAAHASAADELGAGEADLLAQHVDQQGIGVARQRARRAVECEAARHAALLVSHRNSRPRQ